MRISIMVLESDGGSTRSVETNVQTLYATACVLVGTLMSIVYIGWKIGELTARL
jgi:hypothetical protein